MENVSTAEAQATEEVSKFEIAVRKDKAGELDGNKSTAIIRNNVPYDL